MSVDLLAELEAAGVHLTRNDDVLRVRSKPGVDPAPYRERIHEAKPALLALLREREVIADLVDQLVAGWDWLDGHPQHPEHEAFLSRWLCRLSTYERAYAAHHEQGEE